MEELVVENLTCSYNGVKPVVKDVSFRALSGELVFLLGPIGSGKTTILRCILGLLKPLRGRVVFNGVNLASLPPRERARLVGYVPQQLTPSDLTVFDAILLGRYPYSSGLGPSRRDYEVTAKVISMLGLADLATRRLSQLSGGQLQKTAIARALAQEPRILLLDEPTSNLDPKARIEVMNIIRRIARKHGRIVLISSHDLDLAARYADRIVMIREGRITALGGVEVLNEKNIYETYGLKVEITWHRGRPIILPVDVEEE